jgi:hypothetical protein
MKTSQRQHLQQAIHTGKDNPTDEHAILPKTNHTPIHKQTGTQMTGPNLSQVHQRTQIMLPSLRETTPRTRLAWSMDNGGTDTYQAFGAGLSSVG